MQLTPIRAMLGAAALAAMTWSAGAFAQAKVIHYTHYQPGRPDQPKHAAALAFKEHVEKATNGSIKVEIYPAGQLGNAATIMEQLSLGATEMAVVHDGGISGTFKPIDVLSLPYVFKDHATAWKVLDGPFGRDFGDAMLKQVHIRLLGFADNGIRHFTNSKRPIVTPADLKGMKIRVQPSQVYIKLVEAFGASATAVDWGELPAALAQGLVDGQENSVTNIMAGSLYQHQKYATLDGHVYSVHAYLVSETFWKKLSPAEQKAIGEGAEIAKKIHRDMTSAQDKNAKKELEAKGMQVQELTAQQVKAFADVAQPPVRAFLEKDIGKVWVDKLLKAVADVEKGS